MNNPGLYEWLALRRVADGGMAKSAGVYFDQGRPVPGRLIEVLDRLVWSGLLTVAEGDPIWELRHIRLSEAGQARYGVLGQREREHHTKLKVPPPEFGTISTLTPGSRQVSDPEFPAPGDWQEPKG